MTSAADQSNFPTMIIPRGTEIRVNQHGQLSIKTPGNLVIQNSGLYSELESTNGRMLSAVRNARPEREARRPVGTGRSGSPRD